MVDVGPTVLTVAGRASLGSWSGRPLELGDTPEDVPIFVPFKTRDGAIQAYALRIDDQKYIDFPDDVRPLDPFEGPRVFDLGADPGERRNLFEEDAAARWSNAIRQLEARYPLRAETQEVEGNFTEELRALGYLGRE